MDIAKVEIRANSDVPIIRTKRIPCSREHGKLCFCLTEMLLSAKNATCPPYRSGRFFSKVEKPCCCQITNS